MLQLEGKTILREPLFFKHTREEVHKILSQLFLSVLIHKRSEKNRIRRKKVMSAEADEIAVYPPSQERKEILGEKFLLNIARLCFAVTILGLNACLR